MRCFSYETKISRQNYYFNKDNSLYEVHLINSSKKFTLVKIPYFSQFKKQFSPGSLLPQLMQKIYKVKIAIFFKLYFIFKLYNIVLVLPYIKMNPPQAYTCSPS